ncbi:50S ribosomal protein L21 [Patescibacteria group bacterium]|nr:50S ribosomal protein L21 [Patescibacteria group bacterium]
MGAIIRTGGKQYLVNVGDIVDIEKLEGVSGDKVTFEEVLAVFGDKNEITLGDPVIADAKVEGELIDQYKDKKILVFKMKRRTRYRKTQGHRQNLTKVKITKISS